MRQPASSGRSWLGLHAGPAVACSPAVLPVERGAAPHQYRLEPTLRLLMVYLPNVTPGVDWARGPFRYSGSTASTPSEASRRHVLCPT